ncbi:VOC family protein [Falsigemmobacter faecalis]|nr:VOC family protein [Falsigemmobacter faecalis]
MFALPVDHLVALVPDLQAAGAAFAAAGFTTTPLAHHSAAMGTANICVMFENGYLELMGILQETEANEGWRSLLALGPGFRGVAFDSPDIEATALALSDQGLAPEPVRHFSRRVPEGALRFSVTRLSRALTPGLQCLYCQHHTRDLLWLPHLLRHANGARTMLAAELPAAASLAPLQRLAAAGPGLLPLAAGPSRLVLSVPAGAGAPSEAALAEVLATSGLSLQFR